MIIQIILIGISVLMLSRIFYKYKKQELIIREAIIWSIFWIFVSLVALIPDATTQVAHIVGVGRGADLVIYISLIILFYSLFKLLGRLYDLDKNITKLVQHIAIKDAKKKEE